MSWLNPIALWGLIALVIPIVIHFWSKNKTKEIAFGSIRFLRESSTRQSKRIQLSELPLLIIRILILIFMVWLLAKWVHYEDSEKRTAVLLGTGIKVPKAYSEEEIAIFRTSEYDSNRMVNQWYVLEEFGLRNPEIDSLTYINDFKDTDFIGAIPELGFHLQLISLSQTQNSADAKSLDTLLIYFENLKAQEEQTFSKVLKANELYLGAKVKFKMGSKTTANLIITNSVQKSSVHQIVITDTISSDYIVRREHKYSLLYLNRNWIKDPINEDQFLLVVSEYLAQIVEPNYQYSSFEALYSRSSGQKVAVRKANIFSSELLWIILLLIMLERYLSYRKQHA